MVFMIVRKTCQKSANIYKGKIILIANEHNRSQESRFPTIFYIIS